MITTQTPDIDRALQNLVRAKLPIRLEAELQHIVNVLFTIAAQTPLTSESVATAMTNRLARLYRITGCDDLLDAASALGAKVSCHMLGAEITPAAPAEQDKADPADLKAAALAAQPWRELAGLHGQAHGALGEAERVLERLRKLEEGLDAAWKAAANLAAPAEQDKADPAGAQQ